MIRLVRTVNEQYTPINPVDCPALESIDRNCGEGFNELFKHQQMRSYDEIYDWLESNIPLGVDIWEPLLRTMIEVTAIQYCVIVTGLTYNVFGPPSIGQNFSPDNCSGFRGKWWPKFLDDFEEAVATGRRNLIEEMSALPLPGEQPELELVRNILIVVFLSILVAITKLPPMLLRPAVVLIVGGLMPLVESLIAEGATTNQIISEIMEDDTLVDDITFDMTVQAFIDVYGKSCDEFNEDIEIVLGMLAEFRTFCTACREARDIISIIDNPCSNTNCVDPPCLTRMAELRAEVANRCDRNC